MGGHLCAAQQSIHVTLMEAVSPAQLPSSLLLPHRSLLAFGTSFPWHASWRQMCPLALLCMWPCSKSSPDYLIVSLASQRPFASERWSRECLCGQSQWHVSGCALCVAARRGKRRKDQERSPVCLPVNRWRAEEREWEERWRHTEKRWLKDLAAFCQATTATFHPPCSLSTWLREREMEIKVKTHTSS